MSSSLGGYGGMKSATGSGMGNKGMVPKGYKQFQQFTPEQMELFQNMFSHVGPDSFTSRLAGGDEDIFNQIEAPAMKQFSALQGGLASKFSGMGMGARKGSGFQNASNMATQDFASQLQSNRQNLTRQAMQDLFSMSNELLGKQPFGLVQKQQKQNPWAQILGKFAGAVPGAIASYASGGASDLFGGGGGYSSLPGLEDQFRTGQAYG